MVWQEVPQKGDELVYCQVYAPPTSSDTVSRPSTANGNSLIQRGDSACGKKNFLSPVLIFWNMLCLRKMVGKYYFEFYRIYFGENLRYLG
jgi:hypothetical protein